MTTSFQIVLLSLILIPLAVIAGCSSPQATSSAQATVTPGLPSPVSNTVTIKDFDFNPSSLTVASGTTVTWVNQGSAPHTVTSDQSSPIQFGSNNPLTNGQTYSFTFATPGTYPYHCSIHPSMVGTIIVQ